MTEGVQIAIIVAIPPTIVAVAGLIVGLTSKDAVREVHLSLNSRLDQLLQATKVAALGEGRKAERDERSEQDKNGKAPNCANFVPLRDKEA